RVAQPLPRLEREGPFVHRAGDLRRVAVRAEEPAPEDRVLAVRADRLGRIPGAAAREGEEGGPRVAVDDGDAAVARHLGHRGDANPPCAVLRRRERRHRRRRRPIGGTLLAAFAYERERGGRPAAGHAVAESLTALRVAHDRGPFALV